GACTEWFSVINTVISRGRVDVALYSADAPLFTIGDIFRGEWSGGLKPRGGLVFSYVMNNYWHTNYKAAQGGEFFFEYRIASDVGLKPSRALALLTPPVEGGYIEGDLSISPEAVATAFKKWDLGEGVVLRLLEVDGERKSIILKSTALAGLRLYSANPLEEPVEELGAFSGEAEVELQPRRYTTLIFAR
ncbi:MAG: hypothetical protein JZD41_01850, partial [Thermoproteus sp.]|nr:hypothetical protein [Thermoproteus sp.]